MGLFSKKEAKSSRQTAHRPRPSVSSEAQAVSLRVRARRRLAGAVALVLAAVVILPMLLDGEPRPVPAGIEIAVPQRNAPFNPEFRTAPVDPAFGGDVNAAQNGVDQATGSQQVSGVDVPTTDLTGDGSGASATASEQGAVAANNTSADSSTNAKPEPKPVAATPATATPPPAAPPAPDRTAEALAILEGRTTVARSNTAAAASTGSFVLQVASYSSDSDAQVRVDKLKTQGISNAFVEAATVNERPTFRLRVGPFDSRAAAQAAQARLRTLGYDNGFITTK